MNKLTKNYIYTSAYQVLCILIPLVTTPYLTRTLGKTSLGIDSYVLSVVLLCEVVGSLGTTIYANREIAYVRDDKERLIKTFWEIFFLRMLLCGLISVVYLVIAFHAAYKAAFLIQIITLISYFFDISWIFIGTENVAPVTICNGIVRTITTVSIFSFIHHPEDLLCYISIYAAGQAAIVLFLLIWGKQYILAPKPQKLQIQRHVKPVIALFLPQAASSIYVLFDKTMLGLLASDISRISLYDKAEVIVKAPTVFAAALTTVLMPRIANDFKANRLDRVRVMVRSSVDAMIMFSLPISVGMAIVAPIFVPRYLGLAYVDSVKVVWVLSPIILAIALSNVSGAQFLIAANETKYLGLSYTSSALFNIIGNYLLIPWLNEIGAAITTMIAELLVVVIQYYAVYKRLGKLGLAPAAGKKIAAAACMCLMIVPLGRLGNYIYTGILQILLGMVVYAGVLYLLKDACFLQGCHMVKGYFTGRKG